ncbi:ribose-5-phosphate isomerase RpiA [Chitinophaga alhagiae]|uniref:ribose-5-phosphate isomerase RpiA n=1 Tax=Chitinophaga alhagiae TaxID=2203219 RepID=UPI000E5C0CC0|nr:ribose-5-phosphate isomerase RpiA [Chitinophaga alhagiae]
MQSDLEKENAAQAAVELVVPGMIIGLGTGSTAACAVHAIGRRVKEGLCVQAVPTSAQTAALAEQYGIPLLSIGAAGTIDLTIDGADEFTESLHLVKGGGGALLKEKIVAVKSRRVVIITDASKRVAALGKFWVPVEVVPDAAAYVMRQLAVPGALRQKDGQPFVTEQGNHIIDADFGLIQDAPELDRWLNNIVGVVEHGLFVGIASSVIMGEGSGVRIFES